LTVEIEKNVSPTICQIIIDVKDQTQPKVMNNWSKMLPHFSEIICHKLQLLRRQQDYRQFFRLMGLPEKDF
jgi:hypothetical protein